MANLNDLQVAALIEEIGCAMKVGTPVIDSMRRLENRRLGRIARAAKKVVAGLERGENLSSVIGNVNSPMAKQAAAAVAAAEQSGNHELLNRLALQLRRRSDYRETSRLLWFYPMLLLTIGYAVAVGVMAPLVRNYNGDGVAWPVRVVAVAYWLQSNWWIPPLVGLGCLAAVAAWLHSRGRLPQQARRSLFCETLADQIEHDVPGGAAVEAAAQLSGEIEMQGLREPVFESTRMKELFRDAGSDAIAAIAGGEKQTLVAQLRYLGSIHAEKARRHRYLWTRFMPRMAMVTVGVALTMSYAWWVIAPVYLQVAEW